MSYATDDDRDVFDQTNNVLRPITPPAPMPSNRPIEAPDALIKRICTNTINLIKSGKTRPGADTQGMVEHIDAQILPYIDLDNIAASLAGRSWASASSQQKSTLHAQLRDLFRTNFAHMLNSAKNPNMTFAPLREDPNLEDQVEVNSSLIQSNGQSMALKYRLAKFPGNWKIEDINVLGFWVIEGFKKQVAPSVEKGGIDALIREIANSSKPKESSTRHS